jgi:bacterioferritin (cytochrome b1)
LHLLPTINVWKLYNTIKCKFISVKKGGFVMTVQKDLQKAVAAAESAKGTYASFAQSTDDQTAKQLFTQMSQDMDQHISQLNSRLSVAAQNQLNNQAE